MGWFAEFMGAQSEGELAWIFVGLAGQALFFVRFLIQWIASEKARRSVVPHAFWWFSIFGAMVLLSYALYRADPVFILGQALGVGIYARNLFLIRNEKRAALNELDD